MPPEDAESPAEMDHGIESAEEKEARMHAFVQVAVPKFMALCGEIHSLLRSVKDGVPSVQDRMNLEWTLLPYNALRSAFSDKGTRYVKFDESSLSSISSDDLQLRDNAWKAIRSANLVTLLMDMLDIKQGKKSALPLLQELDNSAFSTLYDPPYESEHDFQNEFEDLFNLAFRVRCRCLVGALATPSDRQPTQTLASLFYEDDNASSSDARQTPESGTYRQLAGININEHNVLAGTYRYLLKELELNMTQGDMSKIIAYVDGRCSEERVMSDLEALALENLGRLTGEPAASNSQRSQPARQESESLFVDPAEDQPASSDSDSESEPEAIHIPALKGPR